MLTLTCVVFYGCARFKPTAPINPRHANTNDTLFTAPADAPTSVKINDFRFNPPVVEDITIIKLSTPTNQGNVILAARFAEDKRLGREIALRPDGNLTLLHDDGKDGDETAGDRVFSAIVPMDFASLAAQQRRVIAALEKQGKPVTVRHFSGREIVKHEKFDRAALDRLFLGDRIRLIPIGADTVDEHRSLLITATSVVEDPDRTFNPCTGMGMPMGKWTFGYLMQQLANEPLTGINPSDFTLRWLNRWVHDQTVNDFTVPARAVPMQEIIDQWPKQPNGRLDLSRAPMKLLAIVNRIDLANNTTYGNGNAGEGRFVFGVVNPSESCSPIEFTVIFEYGVPRRTCSEIKAWANQWLDLSTFLLGSSDYNTALEAITEQFVRANADPSKPNGSALNQLRTDEFSLGIPLSQPWELREFRIFATDSDAGQLRLVTAKQTPDRATYLFADPGQAALAAWINANAPAILLDRHTVPLNLPPPSIAPFLGGASPNGFGSPFSSDFWNAPGISDSQARFHFSLNTCNGCHARETRTEFYHVNPASFGSESVLSGFLVGDGSGGDFHVADPAGSGTIRSFFDLKRRAQILHDFATQDCLLGIRFRPILMTH